ncbi:hypothetical protein [Arcanobacterium phocae]|uniref:hypothetical protein n=1 Tax=Arcanobacterium phocae TaxID=131112 RepID=UPI001C0F383C|nr:hypothetical protein [Arcanobacterium phocae]
MFWQHDRERVQCELDDVKQQISANPLSDDAVVKASALIEQLKADGCEDEIDSRLAEQGLPGVESIGKLILQNSFSLARLNKTRIKLEKKLSSAI